MTHPFIWSSSERGLIFLGVSIVRICGRTVTIIPALKFFWLNKIKTGFYVSAADATYECALPPSNVGHDRNKLAAVDYHVYEIATLLDEVGGPIKPWFGQPGP